MYCVTSKSIRQKRLLFILPSIVSEVKIFCFSGNKFFHVSLTLKINQSLVFTMFSTKLFLFLIPTRWCQAGHPHFKSWNVDVEILLRLAQNKPMKSTKNFAENFFSSSPCYPLSLGWSFSLSFPCWPTSNDCSLAPQWTLLLITSSRSGGNLSTGMGEPAACVKFSPDALKMLRLHLRWSYSLSPRSQNSKYRPKVWQYVWRVPRRLWIDT